MADTDIELKIGLDTKDVTPRAKALSKEISRIFKAQDAKELDSKMMSLQSTMAKLSNQAQKTSEKMEELANTKVPTEAFDAAVKKVEALEAELAKAQSEYQEATQMKGASDMEAYLSPYISDVKRLQEQLAAAKQESQNLIDTGKAYTDEGFDVGKYQDLSNSLLNTTNQMSVAIAKAYEYDESLKDAAVGESEAASKGESYRGILESLQWALGRIKADMAGVSFKSVTSGLASIGGKAGKLAISTLKQIGRLLLTVGKNAMSVAATGLKKFGAAFKNAFNTKHTSAFGKTFKQMLMAILGVRGVYMLFRKMVSAIKEGITNMAKFNGGNNQVNQSISMLMSSLTQLKNALAVAVAPILTIVAPALNTLIQLLTTAANAIGMFFAKLGGSSTVLQATKVNQNYAKSLGSTSKSADKATKSLAAFDDLNVLDKNDSGGAGSGGAGGIDPNSMFQEVPVSDAVSDLVDKIKEAWANSDFTDIGLMIGSRLRDALDVASDYLETVAQPFATKLGLCIATFLNGFFMTPGLGESLGRAIGDVLNVAINFAYALLTTFNFQQFGTFIGTSLTSAITTIDWDKLGVAVAAGFNGIFETLRGIADGWDASTIAETIAGGINTAFGNINAAEAASNLSVFVLDIWDTLNQLIENINWEQIGEKVGTFISNLDWVGVVTNIFTSLSDIGIAILDGISGLLSGIDWFQLGQDVIDMIATAFTSVDWGGLTTSIFTILGKAVAGLISLAAGLGTKLWEALQAAWDNVVAWWKDAAFEDGQFTMQGLLDGILDIFKSIGTWLYDHVFEPFIDGFKDCFDIHSPSKIMKEMGKFIVEGLLIPIMEMPKKVLAWFIKMKDDIIFKLGEIVTNAKQKFDALKSEVVTRVENLKSAIYDKFQAIKTAIKDKVDLIKQNTVDKFSAMKDSISSVMQGVKSAIVDTFSHIWSGIKSPINSILGGIEMFVNGVINGINKMISAINGLHFDLPDWLPVVGGKSLGFKVPQLGNVSIPKLAQGAVIPPNQEFLAMLGDQKHGTNIEAPLETIMEALANVLDARESSQPATSQNVTLEIDGNTLARLMLPYNLEELHRRGFNVDILGVN